MRSTKELILLSLFHISIFNIFIFLANRILGVTLIYFDYEVAAKYAMRAYEGVES
jgi:hypothetical protein